ADGGKIREPSVKINRAALGDGDNQVRRRLLFSGGRPRQVDFDAAFDRAKRCKQHEEDEEKHDDVDHRQHLDAGLPVPDPATRLKSHRGLPPLVIRSVSSSARRLISRTLRSIWLLSQW